MSIDWEQPIYVLKAHLRSPDAPIVVQTIVLGCSFDRIALVREMERQQNNDKQATEQRATINQYASKWLREHRTPELTPMKSRPRFPPSGLVPDELKQQRATIVAENDQIAEANGTAMAKWLEQKDAYLETIYRQLGGRIESHNAAAYEIVPTFYFISTSR